MTLAIMRHGQTHYNANKRVQGQINIPLDATGRAQAKEAGNRLKNAGHPFDIIASSPLSRALESATIIRDTLGMRDPIRVVERFIERDFGHLDGQAVDDVVHLFRNNDYRHETYEHNAALIRRVTAGAYGLARLHPDKRVFAVAHSHVIKALLIASDAPTTTFGDIIKNGDIVRFDIGDGTIRFLEMEKA